MAVEFEKSSNKKFIERKRIFAGEPKLEFEIQKHYRDKGSVPSYNVSGRPLTFNEAISRQVDVSTRAARELRDETRTFGIYLASPNRRGEGRRKSGVLLATAKVGDETKLETESRFESRGER